MRHEQELSTRVPLFDLGERDPRFSGIFTPAYDDALVEKYLTPQFLSESDEYLAKYQSTEHWTCLLRVAASFFSRLAKNPKAILDLGSGGGNTVFPLLDMFPNASVVASDLSLPLLRSLKHHKDHNYPKQSCRVVQLNAEEIAYDNDQFDLVVGAAVLHHLYEPVKAISETARVLRPGGTAVYFEPFETGNQLLMLSLARLLKINDTQSEKLSENVCRFFNRLIEDFALRSGTDKSAPVYRNLDDKWIFTRTYIEHCAKSTGLEVTAIYNLYPSQTMFSDHLNTYLLVGLGETLINLPGWAADEVRLLDTNFSDEARAELMIEGGIVLKKPD